MNTTPGLEIGHDRFLTEVFVNLQICCFKIFFKKTYPTLSYQYQKWCLPVACCQSKVVKYACKRLTFSQHYFWTTIYIPSPLRHGDADNLIFQVAFLFLQWLPWLLKMARPGEKITRQDMETKFSFKLCLYFVSWWSRCKGICKMDTDWHLTLQSFFRTTPPNNLFNCVRAILENVDSFIHSKKIELLF